MDNEYKAIELSDEELAQVSGGLITPGSSGDNIASSTCAYCTVGSACYNTCGKRTNDPSKCKFNQ